MPSETSPVTKSLPLYTAFMLIELLLNHMTGGGPKGEVRQVSLSPVDRDCYGVDMSLFWQRREMLMRKGILYLGEPFEETPPTSSSLETWT